MYKFVRSSIGNGERHFKNSNIKLVRFLQYAILIRQQFKIIIINYSYLYVVAEQLTSL